MIVACGSDSDVVQTNLTNTDWTLETIRESDRRDNGRFQLETNWRLSFQADGSVDGDGLCNVGSGHWQSDDTTLNITDWSQEDSALCSSSANPNSTVMARLFGGETFMQRIDGGRLFLETGDNVQLVFSGRVRRAGEHVVPFETLVRTLNFGRSLNLVLTGSQPPTRFVVYRDAASLNADLAEMLGDETLWPELPVIDFDKSIVIGAYLPFDPQEASDVLVRSARIAEPGLEIEIAHFGRHVADEASAICGANDSENAPWTLARIDSVIEPVRIAEMARAFCSGIPAPD